MTTISLLFQMGLAHSDLWCWYFYTFNFSLFSSLHGLSNTVLSSHFCPTYMWILLESWHEYVEVHPFCSSRIQSFDATRKCLVCQPGMWFCIQFDFCIFVQSFGKWKSYFEIYLTFWIGFMVSSLLMACLDSATD